MRQREFMPNNLKAKLREIVQLADRLITYGQQQDAAALRELVDDPEVNAWRQSVLSLPDPVMRGDAKW